MQNFTLKTFFFSFPNSIIFNNTIYFLPLKTYVYFPPYIKNILLCDVGGTGDIMSERTDMLTSTITTVANVKFKK